MKNAIKLAAFAMVFLLHSVTMYAQTFTTAYSSQSGDVAVVIQSFSGTMSVGTVMFKDSGKDCKITSQAAPYFTGGVTIDTNKMTQQLMNGFVDPSSYMKSEPIKMIHTDFASNGYKVRRFDMDSPRKDQLDITFPSGRTVTYHYDKELTNQINSGSQPQPAPISPSSPMPFSPASPGGGTVGNRIQCKNCYGTGLCNLCKGNYKQNCTYCNGTGKKVYGYGTNAKYETCAVCRGMGYTLCAAFGSTCQSGKCSSCRGTGYLNL